jgi:2-succinyl-5-enolpyruvyl-6-hydroxy-3-cyclohexene-1-carboxylate synthase
MAARVGKPSGAVSWPITLTRASDHDTEGENWTTAGRPGPELDTFSPPGSSFRAKARRSARLPASDNEDVNPSTALATVLVDELIANGITDAVLAPGSRNAPLSLALADADATGRIRLHVRIDERTAGFLALGLAKGSGRPVPVCTTSGTAVANLHPAVLEAHHAGVPLVVISADRPPRLRDVGANQTVDQTRLFGPTLRFFHEFGLPGRASGQNAPWRSMLCRALAHATAATGGMPGPVQLNVPLDDPLLPDLDPAADWPESLAGAGVPWTAYPEVSRSGPPVPAPAAGERVLFVADLTHPAADAIAHAGFPVVSEAGGAAGRSVLAAGLHLLADPPFLAAHRPERVVVLGRPTLYRSVQRLLGDHAVTVDVVAPPTHAADPTGRARTISPALAAFDDPPDPTWATAWQQANRAAGTVVRQILSGVDLGASPKLAATVVAAAPGGSDLVLGSSQSPRDVGLFAPARAGVTVHANRGVAGIDGTNSAAVGVALATARPTTALVGDLTFVHDLTGLVVGPHEPRPELTIVVSNNDGGAIFGTLEPGEPGRERYFERVFGTPHGASLGLLAEGAGAEHLLVTEPSELTELLAAPDGLRVVEVPTTRSDLREFLARVRSAVASTLTG